MYVAKTNWQALIDSALASGQPITAQMLRDFEQNLLDSFLHLDDASSITSPTTLYTYVLYVNADNGNDSTAQEGNINKPYYSIYGAFNAALNYGTNPVLIVVFPNGGGYTENNSLTAFSNSNISFYFLPETQVFKYSSGPLFEINGCSNYNIYGRGIFTHYGSGGSSLHTHVYYDNGNVTGIGNTFEFKRISAQGGPAIWLTDGLGSSTPHLTKFKGDYVEGAYGSCFFLQSSRNYHIEVDVILCTAGFGIEHNTNTSSKLYIKAKRVQSTNNNAIYSTGLASNFLLFDIESCIANIFSGYASYFFDYTYSGNNGSIIRVNNHSPSTSIYSAGRDGVNYDFVGIFISVDCRNGGNFYVDKAAVLTAGTGSVVQSSYISKADVLGGTFIYNGYSKIATSEYMVRLNGGKFVLRGTLFNATSALNTGIIQSTGTSYLEIDPGSRIINGYSGTAFSIIIYSGTLNIRSFGKYYFNKAISGTPNYVVGSSADETLNTSL